MISDIAEKYFEKVHISHDDNLTGLYNHGIFDEFLRWEINRFKRYASPFVFGFIDIDGFGYFNRRHGAIEGDVMLKKIAEIILINIRQSDMASRYKGDRFAVLLLKTTPEGAAVAAERIRTAVHVVSGHRLTVSIGLSYVFETTPLEMDDVIRMANVALTEAKLQGKNKTVWFQKKSKEMETRSGRILVVDDEPLNLKLMEALLMPLGYGVIKAGCGREALSVLSRTDIDLILLDVMMPEMDGFEVCRHIKSREDSRLIPIIMVTALTDSEHRIKGIEAGADDFISKPPNSMELLARTRSLLRVKHLTQNMASIENVLFSLANAVEAKDSYTQGHVKRVSELAIAIGRRLLRPEQELDSLKIGGALHDIGKIGVPREILNKTGSLTTEEWDMMKRHPVYGYNICLPLKRNLKQALDVVRHHHEKMDGSGYPDGLKGNEISLPARIMAVADIYDALTTDRPYRSAMSKEKALLILREEADQGKLDKDVVAGLLHVMEQSED